MATLTVNGKQLTVEDGITVLQACEMAGAEIPRFCYHERLSIAGNCRMCLVDIEKSPKPVASCAMPVGEGMVIHTDTPKVKKAREGVMEFLLINHPLDCPICDQGGECDLQDQAMAYGSGASRYKETKRSVKEKDLGPLVKTFMTRCIHCTRCIRFGQDVAGAEEMGAVFRGEDMEVGTYIEQYISSELSGNIIDLCPVGALTSKPYAFKVRSWELEKTESIDVLDAVGSAIRIDSRGREVMRVLPRINEEVNEEWISDKTRFAYDGLKLQRLDRPYVRRHGKLEACSWNEALATIADKLKQVSGTKIAAIAGDMADVESMYLLKRLLASLGSDNLECRQDGAALDASDRASYVFNTTIAGIEQADACLLVGTNPKVEAPIINARLRKRYLRGNFPIGVVGSNDELTYRYTHCGSDPAALQAILDGTHEFAARLEKAEKPMLIIGQDALAREDGAAILQLCKQIADTFGLVSDSWNGFNVLHKAASRVGALDLGFVSSRFDSVDALLDATSRGDIEVVFLLGADEIEFKKLDSAFVIYQGHHGDAGAHRADVILPGAAYTEKDGIYVNTEGRVQYGNRAVFAPGEAKEDWEIIVQLSDILSKPLGHTKLSQVRKQLIKDYPSFDVPDTIAKSVWKKASGGVASVKASVPFELTLLNYYMTDPISRSSKTMALCSEQLRGAARKSPVNSCCAA
ncbi:MAG: NADH-quinone oxidoreductase subunit G [Alphaproteobacteria bacterium]|nr:NADH-quinone oxidoreductase subunit G [Alphaproteobacteria bacterium]